MTKTNEAELFSLALYSSILSLPFGNLTSVICIFFGLFVIIYLGR